VRQAGGRVATPTGLRFLGLAGSITVAVSGVRPVGLLGVAVLAGAWLGIRRVTEPRWLLVTAAWWALPLLVAPPLFSGDAVAYACQGDLLAHGLNPYHHGVADLPCRWLPRMPELWWHTTTPYGPLWVSLTGVVAAAGRWWLAVGLLRAVALAGMFLIIGYGPRLARAVGGDPSRVAWLGVAGPLVLLHGVSGVHNDALLAGLVVAGLASAVDARWGLRAGVLLGLAVAVKVTALVAVPFAVLLVAKGRRPYLTVGAAVAGTFGVVTAATGLGLGWLGALSQTATALVQWTSAPTGVGMAAGFLLRWTGRPELQPIPLAIARTLGLLALVVILVRLWWTARDRPTAVRNAGAALAATALLGPVFFSWYALVPLAVLSAAPLPERAWRWLGWLVAALALIVLPDGRGIASMTKPVGSFFDVALVTVLLVVWLRRGRAGPTPTAR
jgi:alpha-1,6-mannosyltransferase